MIYNDSKLCFSPVHKYQLFCMQIHVCHVSQFFEVGPCFEVKNDFSLCVEIFIAKIRWLCKAAFLYHYIDVIMKARESQITSLSIAYLTVYSGADHRKHQSSAVTGLLARNSPVTGKFLAQRVNSSHKGPVTRKRLPFWWRHHVEKAPGCFLDWKWLIYRKQARNMLYGLCCDRLQIS